VNNPLNVEALRQHLDAAAPMRQKLENRQVQPTLDRRTELRRSRGALRRARRTHRACHWFGS
jgi:hypothetical protein